MADAKNYKKAVPALKEKYKNVNNAFITELLTNENSDTLGSGFFILDSSSFKFLYSYDEVILVLKGVLKVIIKDRLIELIAGEVFFAKKNLEVLFKTDTYTEWFYVTYPPD